MNDQHGQVKYPVKHAINIVYPGVIVIIGDPSVEMVGLVHSADLPPRFSVEVEIHLESYTLY